MLVASADGVGTKLEVARLAGRYDTVGIDLVAMLVDDLACVGAEPLFCSTTWPSALVNPAQLEVLDRRHRRGLSPGGRALLGGETAEHGGVMKPDDLDVAGFALGVVERGDALVGAARRARATRWSAFTHPVCDPTATRWRERSWCATPRRSTEPAYPGARDHAGRGALGAVGHLRTVYRRAAA